MSRHANFDALVENLLREETKNTEAEQRSTQTKQWMDKISTRMNAAPLSMSGATALIVLLVLLTIRPPFIYSRKRSRVHSHMHVETISPTRLSVWVAISFAVTLVGSDVLAMCQG